MTTLNFTSLRAFLRRFFYKAACFYASEHLAQIIALKAVGQHITVKKFPDYHGLGMTHPAGRYFVDSVVLHHTGQIELGLSNTDQEHIDYYDFNDLAID
jgi:hypothetical protein